MVGRSNREIGSDWTDVTEYTQQQELPMLILTRRVGESIVIGNDIVVTVLGVHGNQVRIGIQAPVDVTINREEVHNRIREQEAHVADSGAR